MEQPYGTLVTNIILQDTAAFLLKLWCEAMLCKVDYGPAASEITRSLLGMQIILLHSRPMDSEPLGMESRILYLNKAVTMHIKV